VPAEGENRTNTIKGDIINQDGVGLVLRNVKMKVTINNIKINELQFMYTNIRSVLNNNKLEELTKRLQEGNVDILGITESWMKVDIDSAEVNIPGYVLYRKDRNYEDITNGGGVLLYVKNSLKSIEIVNNDNTESIWINIFPTKSVSIIIGVCYKTPSITQINEEKLFKVIKKMAVKSCIIMGDFNMPDID